MVPGCVFRVLGCVNMVRVGQVGVMRGLVVIAGLMALRRFRVVMRSHPVMMRCLMVFVHCLI